MTWLAGELHRIANVLFIAAVVFGIGYVLYIFFVKKSFVALVAALLTAGIFIWGLGHIGWFQGQVSNETKQNGSAGGSISGVNVNAPVLNRPGIVSVISGLGRGNR